MTRPAQARLAYTLSIVAVGTPFAFGLIRAARTGDDFRYFWVALASVTGATLALKVAHTYTRSALMFVVATLFAVSAAWLLGTAPGIGILVVATAFALCFTAGGSLLMLARSHRGTAPGDDAPNTLR